MCINEQGLYTYQHTCRFLVSQTLYEQYTLCFLSGTKQEKDKMEVKKCSSCTSLFWFTGVVHCTRQHLAVIRLPRMQVVVLVQIQLEFDIQFHFI